ncbi:MAG: S8 family serine peptidase [Hyphomicrobiales bacterium]|nr:S8 family serine peptidase [Hyphomicrobiales bacterium]
MRNAIIIGVLVVLLIAVGGLWLFLKTEEGGQHQVAQHVGGGVAVTGAGKSGQAATGGTSGTGGAGSAPGAGTGAGAAVDEQFEPGEVLVVDPPRTFEQDSAILGYSVLERANLQNLQMDMLRLSVPQGQGVLQSRQQLRNQFPGLSVDANHHYETQAVTVGDTSKVRAEIGWGPAPNACGAGVRLGMIDGGVDVNHPALVGQQVTFRSFHKAGRRPGPADHGTSIAAMLVGRPANNAWGGLLPAAELFAANMFEYAPHNQIVGSASGLLKAIDWLTGLHVHVINLSVAGPDNELLRRAFDRAKGKGVALVAAAGNWGRADKPAYPAAYDHVLAVTAIAAKSRTVYRFANSGDYIDFAAPGVHIWTAVPGGGRFQSGTSMAAPYISAAVGVKVAAGADRSPDALRRILRQVVVDLGTPGKDKVFGWGLLHDEPGCVH